MFPTFPLLPPLSLFPLRFTAPPSPPPPQVSQELGENLTDDELREMIDEADRNGDEKIDAEEFYRVMKKRGDNPLDDLDSDDD